MTDRSWAGSDIATWPFDFCTQAQAKHTNFCQYNLLLAAPLSVNNKPNKAYQQEVKVIWQKSASNRANVYNEKTFNLNGDKFTRLAHH